MIVLNNKKMKSLKIKIKDNRKSKIQSIYKIVPYFYVLLIMIQEVLITSDVSINPNLFTYCIYGIAVGLILFEIFQLLINLRKERTIYLFPMLFYIFVLGVYAYLKICVIS